MATKTQITLKDGRSVAGYDANGVLGVFLDDDGLWKGVKLSNGMLLVGPNGLWKKKRAALAFVETVSSLNWDGVDTEEQHYAANGGYDAVYAVYSEAVRKGRELDG